MTKCDWDTYPFRASLCLFRSIFEVALLYEVRLELDEKKFRKDQPKVNVRRFENLQDERRSTEVAESAKSE